MARKLGGTAQFLNEVFTVQGGKKNYEHGIEARGALKGMLMVYGGMALVKLVEIGMNTAKKSKKGE